MLTSALLKEKLDELQQKLASTERNYKAKDIEVSQQKRLPTNSMDFGQKYHFICYLFELLVHDVSIHPELIMLLLAMLHL